MFAIFFTKAMDPFYAIVMSFPTIIFTIFVVLSVFYWLLAVLGLIDLDFLHIDFHHGDTDFDLGGSDHLSSLNVLGGILFKFGLNGVPLAIVISLVSIFGWFVSYYAVYFSSPLVPDGFLEFLLGIPILVFSLYVACLITGLIIKPLRPLFKSMSQEVEKEIVGQIATIRTSRADNSFGEAIVEDGGAGLIVKVRAYKDEVFERGDKVALLEYVEDQHVYRIISETEFKN